MATRRQETQRLLAGRNSASPLEMTADFALSPAVPRNVPGVRNPNMPQLSAQDQVLSSMAAWGSKKIREKAKTRYEAAALDGAMAHQQGVAAETLDPDDNGWALEGYRTMDAATASSALLQAQQHEITSGAYELDPEGYRKVMVGRMEQMLEGKDERTQELIKQQMAEQMPTLVGQHVAANLEYKEQQTYDALVNTFSIVSKDPASAGKLLSFAKGESGSNGLSTERRQSAVVDGIVRAYELDNPAAYSVLKGSGVLETLSATDLSRLRSAQNTFEGRRRSEYDPAFMEKERAIGQRIQSGEYIDPMEAVAEYAELYRDRGITLDASEAEQVLDVAEDAGAAHSRATVLGIETARMQGDYNAIADMTGAYIVHIESRGNRNAVSSAGAKSEWQVMDGTNADPGYGVRPAQDDTLAERARVGQDYWRAMVRQYSGDVEAAAVAYNAGPGNANMWLKNGRDYSKLPDQKQTQGYTRQLLGLIGGERYVTAIGRATSAEATQKEVKERMALDNYNAAAPLRARIDRALAAGDLTEEQYDIQMRNVDARYSLAQTTANIDHRVQQVDNRIKAVEREAEAAAKKVADKAEAEAKKAANEAEAEAKRAAAKAETEAAKDNMAAFKTNKVQLDAALDQTMGLILKAKKPEGQMSDAEWVTAQNELAQAAGQEYQQAVVKEANAFGIPYNDQDEAGVTEKVIKATTEVMNKQREAAKEQALIQRAVQFGTVADLSPALQDKAWQQNQTALMNNVKAEVAARRISPEDGQRAIEAGAQAYYVRAGHVPAVVRNVASAALNSELVGPNGELKPAAISTITEYANIRTKSKAAADQYLDPAAKATAEAVLSLSGGNVGLIPGALQEVWAKGLNTAFTGKPDPAFMQRPEVVSALNATVREKWIGTKMVIQGTATPVTMSDNAQASLRGLLEANVLNAHSWNPRIEPKHLVDHALSATMASVGVVNGELLMDPFGGDLYADVFGPAANSYRSDPGSIGTALDTYVQSPEFRSQYPDFMPTVDASAQFFGTLGGTDATDRAFLGNKAGRMVYDTVAVGKGMVMLEFIVNTEGARQQIVLPLKTIGDNLRKRDRQNTR